MTRKTNVFPKYVKLKIDKNVPPQDLWERGARRCIKCGTNWPAYSIFTPSPCCNTNTTVVEDGPYMTWREAVVKLLNARFDRYYDKWNDDVTDEALMWDESIEIPIDEEDLRQGMEEIDRLTDSQKTSMEN